MLQSAVETLGILPNHHQVDAAVYNDDSVAIRTDSEVRAAATNSVALGSGSIFSFAVPIEPATASDKAA